MGSLSASLLPSLFSPPIFPRITSSLLHPVPRKKRPNHLRPKLPKTLVPDHPNPSAPRTSPPPDAAQYVLIREELAVESAVLEANGPDQLLLETNTWFPGAIIGLSLRFAALFAVQTVAAVWLLGGAGRGGGEDRGDGGDHKDKEAGLDKEVGNVLELDRELAEFDSKVMEIRAMVRKARESEARSIKDRESGSYRPTKNAGGKSDGARSNLRKGFINFERNDKDGVNGGIQQIANQSLRLTQHGSKRTDEASVNTALPIDKPSFAGGPHMPSGGPSEENGCDPGNPAYRMEENSNSTGSVLSSGVISSRVTTDYSEGYLHTDVSEEALKLDSKPTKSASDVELGTCRQNQSSSTYSGTSVLKSNCTLQTEPAEGKLVKEKKEDGQYDTRKNPWWLNLPYVLAIFLQRGVDCDGPRGLYSLKMDYSLDDRSLPSYTVAFQDHRDATNFCYLLESFFEELGDFSADIVPLRIKELQEAVGSESNELHVIFVRKGQLQLYAGQPLAEVESALREIQDENRPEEIGDTVS